jgi:hypothetical protein
MADFAQHYGSVVLPTQPARPEHKGKVEAGVKYVQNNALKGRSFPSLAEQNLFLADWERRVADTRIHGTVRQQVRALFEVERAGVGAAARLALPQLHRGPAQGASRRHVEFDKAVPPEYLRGVGPG